LNKSKHPKPLAHVFSPNVAAEEKLKALNIELKVSNMRLSERLVAMEQEFNKLKTMYRDLREDKTKTDNNYVIIIHFNTLVTGKSHRVVQ
jgi:replicative DNA helicase